MCARLLLLRLETWFSVPKGQWSTCPGWNCCRICTKMYTLSKNFYVRLWGLECRIDLEDSSSGYLLWKELPRGGVKGMLKVLRGSDI